MSDENTAKPDLRQSMLGLCHRVLEMAQREEAALAKSAPPCFTKPDEEKDAKKGAKPSFLADKTKKAEGGLPGAPKMNVPKVGVPKAPAAPGAMAKAIKLPGMTPPRSASYPGPKNAGPSAAARQKMGMTPPRSASYPGPKNAGPSAAARQKMGMPSPGGAKLSFDPGVPHAKAEGSLAHLGQCVKCSKGEHSGPC